jgi:hypothetical protein
MGLEESIRTSAGDHLSAVGYTVLTGENTLQLLTDNGVDTTKVCDSTCALSAARELKARLFISGSVAQTEGDYLAFVRLFDPATGQQLASVKLEGKRVKDLRVQFDKQASSFFQRGLKLEGDGAPGRSASSDGSGGPENGRPKATQEGTSSTSRKEASRRNQSGKTAPNDALGPGGIGAGLNSALGGIGRSEVMRDEEGLESQGSDRNRGVSDGFDLGPRILGTTQFIPGRTTVMGGLTADEVGRLMRRHWNEVKYCYEKELTNSPNLAGKVAVYFEIGPVGDVQLAQVKETDLKNADVEECILSNVRRWKFPAPRGGGIVNVNYPFIFQKQQ